MMTRSSFDDSPAPGNPAPAPAPGNTHAAGAVLVESSPRKIVAYLHGPFTPAHAEELRRQAQREGVAIAAGDRILAIDPSRGVPKGALVLDLRTPTDEPAQVRDAIHDAPVGSLTLREFSPALRRAIFRGVFQGATAAGLFLFVLYALFVARWGWSG